MILRHCSCSSFTRVLLAAALATGCGATGASTPGNTLGQGGGSSGNGGSGKGGSVGVGGGGGNASTDVTNLGGEANTGGSPGVGGGGVQPTGGVPATGGAPTGGMPATGGTTCTPGTQIGSSYTSNYFVMAFPQLSPFYIFNNGWSTTAKDLTAAGTQESIAAYDTCTAGTISWSTTYNWTGANNTVKAYPAAILGWQSTKGFQVNPAVSGMPKTISSISSAKCSWAFSVTGGAAQNISFDIWVHNTTCSSTAITASTAASDEVMIWLYSNGGVNPIGYGGATSQVTIGGATWTLYTGSNGTGAVHSFVRSGNTTSVQNLDILAFLNTSSLNLGSKCLSSIEAGTEVFTGSGTLKTDSFSCTVQ